MKKLLVSIFALALMSGCGGNSEPKTVVCSGEVDGGKIDSTINAEGDNVVAEEIISTADLAELGVDATTLSDEDKKLVLDSVKESSGMENLKGVTFSVDLDGNNVITKASINYKETDMDELEKADLVDAGAADFISLEKTVENYEAEGLTCK